MIEEIKKELLNCDVEILYGKFGEEYKYLKHSDVVKLLDEYKKQEMFLNERIDTLKDTQLKQLNKISELENYKNAWEGLQNMFINHIDAKAMNYQDNKLNPNEILNKMQELEQKHIRGDK